MATPTLYSFCTGVHKHRGVCPHANIENCRNSHLVILIMELPGRYLITILTRGDGTVIDAREFQNGSLEKFSDDVSLKFIGLPVTNQEEMDNFLLVLGYTR